MVTVDGTPIRQDVTVIIPARGGSKGVHKKNIMDIAGKPLISYTILSALKAELVNRVVVSTEDEEIADVAVKWGADVPFLRPKSLAEDESCLGDAVDYTIKELGGLEEERVFVTLVPTSLFRTPQFIDDNLEILSKGYRTIRTVKPMHADPDYLFAPTGQDGQLVHIGADSAIAPYYRSYGSLFAVSGIRSKTHYYYTLKDKYYLIDIDTVRDVELAEHIITHNLFDFGF